MLPGEEDEWYAFLMGDTCERIYKGFLTFKRMQQPV